MPRRLLSLVIGLMFASAVWASDTWPQWRGPKRDAVSTEKGLLDRWNGAPGLVWQSEGIGEGCAGAVVEKGTVFTTGVRKGKIMVVAVSEKDGKELWATDFGGAGGRGAQSTPIVDGDRIYALSSDGHLACVNITTGERVWERSFKEDFDGVSSGCGYSESPLVDGDKLICSPGGPEAGIVALNKKTGEEIWRCALVFDKRGANGGAGYASGIVCHAAGVKQYVQFMRNGVVGIEVETGKQLWNYSRTAGPSNPCTPIVHGDHIFAACGWYVGSALLKLVRTEDGGVEAQEIYIIKNNELSTQSGGAVLVGDHVYASDVKTGTPQCIDLWTGKLKWKTEKELGKGPAAVAYADGHLYFRYENGVMALVAATPDKYELKGEFEVPGKHSQLWAHPAICNGRLYLRDHSTIYCYDVKK